MLWPDSTSRTASCLNSSVYRARAAFVIFVPLSLFNHSARDTFCAGKVNLGNLWRRLGLPRGIENWSLTSLQQRLVKTGGRLVKHARYYWLLLAEGHLSRRRFGAMLGRITLLPVPTG